MRSIEFGTTGVTISRLAWGMWRLRGNDPARTARLVGAALDAGITLFDTADVYGLDTGEGFGAAEAAFGQVLTNDASIRNRIFLASKGGIEPGIPYRSGGDALIAACEASLRRLATGHLDLYQVHRPDLLAHPEEVAAALSRLRESGKIRFAGVSNFSPAQTRALLAYLPWLASTQPEFSPLALGALRDGTLDLAMERKLAVLTWSPLAGGRLAGEPTDARAVAVAASLDAVARHLGATREAVALAWALAHPSRPVPIIGSQTPERIAAASACLDIALSPQEWYTILEASLGERLP